MILFFCFLYVWSILTNKNIINQKLGIMVKQNEAPEKKGYVLDTNVCLRDYTCINKFQEHDIILLTTVLEELDNFKKGTDSLGYNARELHRILDGFRKERISKTVKKGNNPVTKKVSALFNGGVSLGEGLGRIEIKAFPRKLHQSVKDLFYDEIPDHQILSAVYQMQVDEKEKRRIVLVTKDINLRLKAEALGIQVEDYEHDKVPTPEKSYMGQEELNDLKLASLMAKIYETGTAPIFGEEYSDCFDKEEVKPNMYFSLGTNSEKSHCLVRVDENMEYFYRVEKKTVCGITPRNSEQIFTVDALLQNDIKFVTLKGKAGTGKTLLSIASAISMVLEGKYDKIVVSAANVPLSDKDPGALPGSGDEKVLPYMQGIYDNVEFIKSQMKGKKIPDKRPIKGAASKRKVVKKQMLADKQYSGEERLDDISTLQKEGKIKIQPLPSIRGRSFNNTVFIIDESQNLTPHEVKTIATRAGENTKVIFCGDTKQIDSPYLDERSNGLSHAIHKMKGQKIVAHITLVKGERSELAELAADLL